MVDVTTEVVIDREVEQVAAFAADPVNAPQWYVNIRSVEWEGEPTLQVGSRVRFLADFLGRRLSYTYEVSAWQPGQGLVMRTAEGPFPMETTYTWQSLEGGRTRMSLRNRGEPAGLARMSGPLLASAMRRANRKDLAALKALLEGQPAPGTGHGLRE